MLKTLIFDFDGTIADTLPAIFNLFNDLAPGLGYPKLNPEEAERLRYLTPREIIKEYDISLFKLPILAVKMRRALNDKISSVKLFKDMDKVLVKLKTDGYHLGILSSNATTNIEKFLVKNKLQVFDFIHSEVNLFGKAGSLKHLMKKHGLKIEETIYIGDEVRDVEACKKNSLKIIAVTWGFNKKETLLVSRPDYLVDKPEEILKVAGQTP